LGSNSASTAVTVRAPGKVVFYHRTVAFDGGEGDDEDAVAVEQSEAQGFQKVDGHQLIAPGDVNFAALNGRDVLRVIAENTLAAVWGDELGFRKSSLHRKGYVCHGSLPRRSPLAREILEHSRLLHLDAVGRRGLEAPGHGLLLLPQPADHFSRRPLCLAGTVAAHDKQLAVLFKIPRGALPYGRDVAVAERVYFFF
jgi:hypothetical protein